MPKKKINQLSITLKRSTIKRLAKQKATIKALGLKRLNQTVVQPDTPIIRGMINKVSHLVTVEELK